MTQQKIAHHYVPRYYLNGFCEHQDSRIIHVYEKGSQKVFSTTSDRIGYERHFYTVKNEDGTKDTNTIEDYLNNEVESPARPVIDKIRNKKMISSEEKLILCRYIAYLIRRVPRGKERLKEMAPSLLDSLSEQINNEITAAISNNPERANFYESRRTQANQIIEQYRANPPVNIMINSLQYQTPRLIQALNEMTWQFLVSSGEHLYFTCDNPVFFDEGLGIGKQYAEISVPISKNIALWITWRTDLREGYVQTTNQAVKEINRRTAYRTTRYIYAAQNASWITAMANKTRYNLTRLL